MKPHPRIRKTIKWGGLTVCIVLAGLWAASERWWVMRAQGQWAIELRRGGAAISHGPDINFRVSPGWYGIVAPPQLGRTWWVRRDETRSITKLSIPLWMPLTLAAACTATAWRFDTLARRRAGTHACAKCGYDRAGIAPESKCPECGSAPIVA